MQHSCHLRLHALRPVESGLGVVWKWAFKRLIDHVIQCPIATQESTTHAARNAVIVRSNGRIYVLFSGDSHNELSTQNVLRAG